MWGWCDRSVRRQAVKQCLASGNTTPIAVATKCLVGAIMGGVRSKGAPHPEKSIPIASALCEPRVSNQAVAGEGFDCCR